MDASPIAIVGVSCRFASAPDPGAFWRMIMHRASGIAPLGEELSLPYGGRNLFDAPYPTHGALLGPLYAFVPREQDVPSELSLGENQDRYFAVQLAFDALADAGMRPHAVEPVRGTVRFGYAPPFNSSTMNWLQHTFFVDQTMEIITHFFRNAPEETLQSVRGELVNSLPAPDAASFLSGSGNSIASGIARECTFSGGATTLDGGALSGIAAIRAAMDDLRSGRADVALAGALTPPLSRPFLEGVSGEVQFATDGDLVPFSRDAHGTVPGEGGAFFVLKREGDALAAHDRIYALVKGVACGSAPLAKLLAAAADRAGVRFRGFESQIPFRWWTGGARKRKGGFFFVASRRPFRGRRRTAVALPAPERPQHDQIAGRNATAICAAWRRRLIKRLRSGSLVGVRGASHGSWRGNEASGPRGSRRGGDRPRGLRPLRDSRPVHGVPVEEGMETRADRTAGGEEPEPARPGEREPEDRPRDPARGGVLRAVSDRRPEGSVPPAGRHAPVQPALPASRAVPRGRPLHAAADGGEDGLPEGGRPAAPAGEGGV